MTFDSGRGELLRAATGLAANYRAAGWARSRREFASKLSVVIEEADASELWLDVLETKCRQPAAVSGLRQESRELRAIFIKSRTTTLEKLRRKRGQGPRANDAA